MDDANHLPQLPANEPPARSDSFWTPTPAPIEAMAPVQSDPAPAGPQLEFPAQAFTSAPSTTVDPRTIPVAAHPMAMDPVHDRGAFHWGRVAEELVAWFKTLFSAAVYATLIVTFGFQVARVEGQSMAPTLEDQDRLIVNKAAYLIGSPQIGDIVMLYYPVDPDKSFVKRVVGEPNDTLRSVDGRVYRNDVPLPDEFIPEEFRSHDTWGPRVVPDGMYFVMGDHRNNSSDSRSWDWVPKKYIIGKVQVRWWPVSHAHFFEPWK